MADIHEIRGYYEGSAKAIYRSVSGTTLHLGMVEPGDESHDVAHQRTKEFLLARLPQVSAETVIFDLGSGFGDMARYLAQRLGCRVVGLNLVHSQNVLSQEFNREVGLDGQVSAVEADFARTPFPSGCADIVWSQEAMLHAPDRDQVVKEAARLLQPGGAFLFTDILQTGPMEREEARLIYERVKIDSLESFDSYKVYLQTAGLHLDEVADLSRYVAPYYDSRVQEMVKNRESLAGSASPEFVDYTIEATQRWVNAAAEGKLGWGMFVARRKSAASGPSAKPGKGSVR